MVPSRRLPLPPSPKETLRIAQDLLSHSPRACRPGVVCLIVQAGISVIFYECPRPREEAQGRFPRERLDSAPAAVVQLLRRSEGSLPPRALHAQWLRGLRALPQAGPCL